MPVLKLIASEGLTNLAVVVTRYFGGIKLGTGGLARAYTAAARLGIEAAGICEVMESRLLVYRFDYSYLTKLQNLAGEGRFEISEPEYSDAVKAGLKCFEEDADEIIGLMNNLTNGQAELLEERKAAFDPVQRRMELADFKQEQDTAGIVPLSQRYLAEYCAMHSKDVYWTGEKVFHSPDRFRAFLAVEDGQIVGYVDVTHQFDTNEVYDLRVKEAFRRRGWGRKLMAKALAENRPNGMLLFADTDNDPAIRLYQSLGFEFVPEGDNQTAF
jgi:ribosomal protein S18 acetylase RimI-like enzyme